MSIKANYVKGERYFYVLRATLALHHLGIPIPHVNLRTECPKLPGYEFHRVRLEVVRTKAEARAMNAKLKAARNRNAAKKGKT